MEKVGIFYGSTSGSTKSVAERMKNVFGEDADLHDIKNVDIATIAEYRNLIFGTSAWGIGDMQDDWEDFIDQLSEIDFSNKKVALFGLGDQEEYPESFVDGLGTMYCRLPVKEAVVGFWPTENYQYYFSLAEKEGKFVGLVIDEHFQKELTDSRIAAWVEQLRTVFV